MRAGLVGLGLLGFFLAVGGTIALPIGGAVSLLWPAVAVQFVLGLWFGWVGVGVGVLFPFASNVLVADLQTALAFTPANFLQSALPLVLFRLLKGSSILQRKTDSLILALSSVTAAVGAASLGVAGLVLLKGPQGGDPATLLISWATSNAFCGFILTWPLLAWVSPVLWEANLIQSQGKGTAFGFHLGGAAFTLAAGAVATAISFHLAVAKGVRFHDP